MNDELKENPSLMKEGPYLVEELLDRKMVNGTFYYLIKWKDFPKNESTWEPIDHVYEGNEFIHQFDKLIELQQEISMKKKVNTNDVPLRIIGCELDPNKELTFTIEWKERDDHSKADNSIHSRQWTIDNCPLLLVQFYERETVLFDL